MFLSKFQSQRSQVLKEYNIEKENYQIVPFPLYDLEYVPENNFKFPNLNDTDFIGGHEFKFDVNFKLMSILLELEPDEDFLIPWFYNINVKDNFCFIIPKRLIPKDTYYTFDYVNDVHLLEMFENFVNLSHLLESCEQKHTHTVSCESLDYDELWDIARNI